MSFIIASIQLNSQADIDQNLDIIRTAVAAATDNGAKLVTLPENACLMGQQAPLAKRFDELCEFFSTLAKDSGIHLIAGTLPCPTLPDGSLVPNGKFRQTSLLFDDQGKQIARYDKIHLFRATVGDAVGSYDEGRTFDAGNELVVAPCVIDGVAVGIGLMICFDVRFPAMAQRLRTLGADIISVPAAFTHTTGKAHWQTLLQARALDSQCFVIGSTQGGIHTFTHKDKIHTRQTWGHSMLVNATGEIVANSDSTECPPSGFNIVYGVFDKDKQEQWRQYLPIFDCAVLS